MRNASRQPPTYLRLKRKKGRDLAFVILGGQRTYLGPYGSPESYEKYKRAVPESAGNLAAHRLKRLEILEPVAPLAIGILLVLVGLFPCKAMAGLIVLSYLILSPVEVIIEGKMQNSILTASRATVLSGASLFRMVSGLPLLAIFGLAARWRGLGAGYVFFGLVLLIFSRWLARDRYLSYRQREEDGHRVRSAAGLGRERPSDLMRHLP